MNVTYFDDAALDTSVKEKRAEQFFTRLVRDLAVSWGEEIPTDVVNADHLKEFVMRARRRSARGPAIAIVDVPSDLPGTDLEHLVKILRVLRSSASDFNLSWLLALQPPYERVHNWLESSGGYYFPRLELKGFSVPEVQDFLKHYPKAAEYDDLSKWLLDLFGGQPFLTHVALERIDHGEQRDSVGAIALQRLDSFGVHIRRMQEALGTDLAAALRYPNIDALSEADLKLLSDMNIFKIDDTGKPRPKWASLLYKRSFGPETSDEL
jgi:hypothetical protein